jgi:hypothetical protein
LVRGDAGEVRRVRRWGDGWPDGRWRRGEAMGAPPRLRATGGRSRRGGRTTAATIGHVSAPPWACGQVAAWLGDGGTASTAHSRRAEGGAGGAVGPRRSRLDMCRLPPWVRGQVAAWRGDEGSRWAEGGAGGAVRPRRPRLDMCRLPVGARAGGSVARRRGHRLDRGQQVGGGQSRRGNQTTTALTAGSSYVAALVGSQALGHEVGRPYTETISLKPESLAFLPFHFLSTFISRLN